MAVDTTQFGNIGYTLPSQSYTSSIQGTGATTNADYNYTVASAGIQSVSSILNAYAGAELFSKKVELDTQNRISNMDSVMDSFTYNEYKLEEQYNYLDSAFADKVTQSTLEAMKAVARAKASSAETGATGTSTNEAINQNIIDHTFEVAVINNERKRSLSGILSQRETLEMQTEKELENLAKQSLAINNNSWLSAVAGGVSSFGAILSTMPKSVSAEVFGFNTSAGFDGATTAIQAKPKGI